MAHSNWFERVLLVCGFSYSFSPLHSFHLSFDSLDSLHSLDSHSQTTRNAHAHTHRYESLVRRAWMLAAIEWFRIDDEIMQNVLTKTASNLLRDPEPRVRFTASCVLAATFPEKSDDLEAHMNVREIETLMLARVNDTSCTRFASVKDITNLKTEGYLDAILLFGEILQRSARVYVILIFESYVHK